MKLSVLPARVEELKKSAARTGAINALMRAKAWVADFDPIEAAQGYPSLKEDGSEFSSGSASHKPGGASASLSTG